MVLENSHIQPPVMQLVFSNERCDVSAVQAASEHSRAVHCCSLSRRMGEGQGEGFADSFSQRRTQLQPLRVILRVDCDFFEDV